MVPSLRALMPPFCTKFSAQRKIDASRQPGLSQMLFFTAKSVCFIKGFALKILGLVSKQVGAF